MAERIVYLVIALLVIAAIVALITRWENRRSREALRRLNQYGLGLRDERLRKEREGREHGTENR